MEFGCKPGTLRLKNGATIDLELLQCILQLADSGLKCRPLRHLGLELFPREAKLLSEPVSLVKVILYGLIQGPVKIVDLGMTLVTLKTNFLLALGQGGMKQLRVVQGRLQLLGQPLQLGLLPAELIVAPAKLLCDLLAFRVRGLEGFVTLVNSLTEPVALGARCLELIVLIPHLLVQLISIRLEPSRAASRCRICSLSWSPSTRAEWISSSR